VTVVAAAAALGLLLAEQVSAYVAPGGGGAPPHNRPATPRAIASPYNSKYAAKEAQWLDLQANPGKWNDFRERKAKGEAKPNFPDFKSQVTADSLWIQSYDTPLWAKMEDFDPDCSPSPPTFGKLAYAANERFAPTEEMWKSLFETPLQWTDFRDSKEAGFSKEKHPDFKQTSSGDALWLNAAPDWVGERLPTSASPWPTFVKPAHAANQRWEPADATVKWDPLFKLPAQWTDFRDAKEAGISKDNHPDFKQKSSGDSLWLEDAPPEVREKVLNPVSPWPKFVKPADAAEERWAPADAAERWEALFEMPWEWTDFRDAKEAGVSKKGHPDFKQMKGSGSLWLDSAPPEVSERLLTAGSPWEKFEKPADAAERMWKDLFEQPELWRDFREDKFYLGLANERHPDFKKQGGSTDSLWVDSWSKPDWVDARLDEIDGAQATETGRRDSPDEVRRREDWASFEREPGSWKDLRAEKELRKGAAFDPDFEHKDNPLQALWLTDPVMPGGVLEALEQGRLATAPRDPPVMPGGPPEPPKHERPHDSKPPMRYVESQYELAKLALRGSRRAAAAAPSDEGERPRSPAGEFDEDVDTWDDVSA